MIKDHPTDPGKVVYESRKYDLNVNANEYERGFIDGMQKQMQSSVDKAVNAMSQRKWVGLTPADFDWLEQVFGNKVSNNFVLAEIVCVISAKLKQKNGYAEEKNT